MTITDEGLMIFQTTPEFLVIAEQLHLNPVFDKKDKDDDADKLLPEQISDEPIVLSNSNHQQKTSFKFTNNGIYAGRKTVAKNVVQIDTHSQQPTFAFNEGLLDKKHERLFKRKKQIEAIDNYKDDPKLVEERSDIKLELNLFCSTNDHGKGRYFNRLLPLYSSMNFTFDALNYWGLSNVLSCVNDGYVIKRPDNFDKKYNSFVHRYDDQIKYLSFSMKKWKYALIKNAQEYLLFNSTKDYKFHNHSLDVKAQYRRITGNSLNSETDEINTEALALAQQKERNVIKVLSNYSFGNQNDVFDVIQDMKKTKHILKEAGALQAQFKEPKQYFYELTLDSTHSDQDKEYINRFTKRILDKKLFVSRTKLPSNSVNILGQSIHAEEIKNLDDYLDQHGMITFAYYIPSIIDSLGEKQSIDSWIQYEIEKINRSQLDTMNQYNLLSLTVQVYANDNHQNSNALMALVEKYRKKKWIDALDMDQIINNDPRTAIVNGQLMVKDSRGIYTSSEGVVNHLLKSHFNMRQKQHFDLSKNNTISLLTDYAFNNHLDNGFKSNSQSILINEHGDIQISSFDKHRISHHVNVDYNPNIVHNPAYGMLNRFLKHLAPKQLRQLKAMLGLIPIQHTGIMQELRTFIVLCGVSGAGKSTLAILLEKLFDDLKQAGSNIVSNTQNVNKAFTDEHYIDLNDSKKGMLMLWFDDFQSASKRNIISASAGTVINGVITGVAQNAAAKYEKEHPVVLPSLIVIATNSMPQVTQEGTAARMFVIDCPQKLKDDPIKDQDGHVVSVNDFINNPKVLEALFYIIMQEASKILKMSEHERAKLFDHKYSAVNKINQLNDSLESFIEDMGFTSMYDFIGMQAIKLYNLFQSQTYASNTSYRSFTDQLEMMGFVLKRKHWGGKNYQKIISAKNDHLTQDKYNTIKYLNVRPDNIVGAPHYDVLDWHQGYEEFKKKYPQDSEIFEPFDFNN